MSAVRSVGGIALSIGLLVGCATSRPTESVSTETVAATPGDADQWTPETVGRMQRLVSAHCTDCHSTPRAAAYTADQWRRILPEMREDADLSPEEYTALLAYVVHFARPN